MRRKLKWYLLAKVKVNTCSAEARIKLPNRKTIKALQDSCRGQGVVTYEGVNALFSSLGI